jgi:hypothetical protein
VVRVVKAKGSGSCDGLGEVERESVRASVAVSGVQGEGDWLAWAPRRGRAGSDDQQSPSPWEGEGATRRHLTTPPLNHFTPVTHRGTRHTTHDTRHSTHDTRHSVLDTRHNVDGLEALPPPPLAVCNNAQL